MPFSMTYVATKISYPLHTKVHILGKLVIPPTHLLISFMCYLSPTQLPTYSLNIRLSTVYQLQQTVSDSATIRENESKFLHCPGTKGQQDKLKILPAMGLYGPGQSVKI